MSYTIVITETAKADIKKHKKAGDKTILKKIEKLLVELIEHPETGTGQPEKLKHNLTGRYSRRINNKHRLIYSIEKDVVTVYVLSAYSHYGNK